MYVRKLKRSPAIPPPAPSLPCTSPTIVRSLPLELGALTRIEKLDLDNNPGNLLPPGFTEKGLDAVMEYFAWNCRYPD